MDAIVASPIDALDDVRREEEEEEEEEEETIQLERYYVHR